MDMFPELFAGDVGLTSMQFATGTADQGAGSNNIAELFNPVVAHPESAANLPQLTVVGIMVQSLNTATTNFSIFTTTNATFVNSAATAGPVWMDGRRADTSIGTFKMGTVAFPGSNEVFRTALPAAAATAGVMPLILPFNWDLIQGQGLLFGVAGAIRSIINVFWVERSQTT